MALKEVKEKKPHTTQMITKSVVDYKVLLRSEIMKIRDNLHQEFESFFNILMG